MNQRNLPISCSVIICLLAATTSFPQLTNFTSFTVGGVWLADNGKHIDCHGGNIIYRAALGTYFWYGEYRATPGGASCYSSRDLYNWKFEGVVMKKGTIQILERPKVVYNEATKKYIMWFHYDGNSYSVAELGVAVSDSAKGPFTLVRHMRPNGHESRDIGMYIDEEKNKVYIGYAADNNSTIRIVELTEDYLDITANDVDSKTHCEGPGILKKNNMYYLLTSQCSGWTPNSATYYTAAAITGPFSNEGSPCINDTARTTFNSQPCYLFKVPGYVDAFLYMGDRWNGGGKPESQYVFLPITINAAGAMELRWHTTWDLSLFTPLAIDTQSGGKRNFRERVFDNAMNPHGLNVCDLLGRMVAKKSDPIAAERTAARLKIIGAASSASNAIRIAE